MTPAPIPPDDASRLAALNALGILGTPDEHYFDCITATGARLFGVPICLVSLVDADRQWFKSCYGLSTRETSRADSICGHVVACRAPMVIPDTHLDVRFADNPLVRHPPRIRFYAGYPLRGPDGSVLGTVCVIDTRPRSFSDADLAQLHNLAYLAETHIAARRVSATQAHLVRKLATARREALIDPMLRIWNYGGLQELLRLQVELSGELGKPFAVCMIDVDRFKPINDLYGHPAGDEVLRRVTQAMRAALRPGHELGRYGGEEFLVLMPNADAAQAEAVATRLMDAVTGLLIPVGEHTLSCTISAGVAEWTPADPEPLDSLVSRADEALLNAKNLGRQRVEMSLNRRRA